MRLTHGQGAVLIEVVARQRGIRMRRTAREPIGSSRAQGSYADAAMVRSISARGAGAGRQGRVCRGIGGGAVLGRAIGGRMAVLVSAAGLTRR